MAFNPFHAREVDEASQRPATEVFKTSAAASEGAISSRFASSGKFTSEDLEADADLANAPEAEEEPDDKRTLYERLQSQKDAKQAEFEYNNAFKNQM